MVEPLITALSQLDALGWLRDVVAYLPFTAGMRLVSAGLTTGQGGEALGRWAGGAVFAGFVALLLALACVLFKRRDA